MANIERAFDWQRTAHQTIGERVYRGRGAGGGGRGAGAFKVRAARSLPHARAPIRGHTIDAENASPNDRKSGPVQSEAIIARTPITHVSDDKERTETARSTREGSSGN